MMVAYGLYNLNGSASITGRDGSDKYGWIAQIEKECRQTIWIEE